MSELRPDLSIIQQWIRPESEILDLGCGEGELLSYLKTEKNVHGYGLEINPEKRRSGTVDGKDGEVVLFTFTIND